MISKRDQAIAELGKGKDESVNVQRYKGLGEMNAEQLWETTMNPESRTMRRVTIESAAEADHVFSMLMGDDVPPRRHFIENPCEVRQYRRLIREKGTGLIYRRPKPTLNPNREDRSSFSE